MISIENQNQGRPTPMNTEFETVLTGLREQKDRNLPEVMRGETGFIGKTQTVSSPSPVPTGPRMTGVVKWFNPTKGFGFITPDHGGLDVFVHQSEIQLPGFRSLAQGEPVEYQLYDGQKGPKALNVTGPQGKQVKGAPRQTKPKPETATSAKNEIQSQLIKLASSYYQVANQMPVSTPVLAPTQVQALNTLPSCLSPTPAAYSHYFVPQPGFHNYYATASDLNSFDMSMHAHPMSPTPMLIDNPMSPIPSYVPMTTVAGQYATSTTPTPFSFPQTSVQMNIMNSPPQTSYGGSPMHFVPQGNNPQEQTPTSFFDETAHMQISSPLSPIHV